MPKPTERPQRLAVGLAASGYAASCPGRLMPGPNGSTVCGYCRAIVYGYRRVAKPAARNGSLPVGIRRG